MFNYLVQQKFIAKPGFLREMIDSHSFIRLEQIVEDITTFHNQYETLEWNRITSQSNN